MKNGTNIKITNNDVLHGRVNRLLLKQNSQNNHNKTKQRERNKKVKRERQNKQAMIALQEMAVFNS